MKIRGNLQLRIHYPVCWSEIDIGERTNFFMTGMEHNVIYQEMVSTDRPTYMKVHVTHSVAPA